MLYFSYIEVEHMLGSARQQWSRSIYCHTSRNRLPGGWQKAKERGSQALSMEAAECESEVLRAEEMSSCGPTITKDWTRVDKALQGCGVTPYESRDSGIGAVFERINIGHAPMSSVSKSTSYMSIWRWLLI
jgi:hypothetical protein